MFRSSLRTALALSAVAFMTACNQYSDGLVGDYQNSSKCPANGCANQAASENYISLSTSTTSATVVGANPVVIGGDCSVSTYPSNVINATVTYQTSGAPVSAAFSGSNSATVSPFCNKGRFDVSVDTRNLPASAVYTLRLELVAYDSTNVAHRNAASGVKTITIRK